MQNKPYFFFGNRGSQKGGRGGGGYLGKIPKKSRLFLGGASYDNDKDEDYHEDFEPQLFSLLALSLYSLQVLLLMIMRAMSCTTMIKGRPP